MEFIPIDKETWPRREYFDHYFSAVPCFYSMTTALDITRLRQEKVRLYPALLYLLTQTVNRHIPFRTAIHNGQLGYLHRFLQRNRDLFLHLDLVPGGLRHLSGRL